MLHDTEVRPVLPDEVRAVLAHLWKAFAWRGIWRAMPGSFPFRAAFPPTWSGRKPPAVARLERVRRTRRRDHHVSGWRSVFSSRPERRFHQRDMLCADRGRRETRSRLAGSGKPVPPASLRRCISSLPPAAVSRSSAELPCWCPTSRILRFDGIVVKQFRQPAPNQETILAAFEESGWAERIDDRFLSTVIPVRNSDCTLRSGRLNRHQEHKLIRFVGDGTGEGICWVRPAGMVSAPDDTLALRRIS